MDVKSRPDRWNLTGCERGARTGGGVGRGGGGGGGGGEGRLEQAADSEAVTLPYKVVVCNELVNQRLNTQWPTTTGLLAGW